MGRQSCKVALTAIVAVERDDFRFCQEDEESELEGEEFRTRFIKKQQLIIYI